jgi:hypothetical protein
MIAEETTSAAVAVASLQLDDRRRLATSAVAVSETGNNHSVAPNTVTNTTPVKQPMTVFMTRAMKLG